MAGTPLRARMVSELATRAVNAGVSLHEEDGRLLAEESAEAYAYAWLAGGAPSGKSPTTLGLSRELGVSYPFLRNWLTRTPEARERLTTAREVCAALLADEALEILDTASPAEAGTARARAEFRKWLASKYDRKTFGEAAGPAVAISVGHLHLAAISEARASRQQVAATVARPTLPPGDVSIVDDPILLQDNDLDLEDLL